MQEFEQLVNTLERLLGPNGCPWDQKQTMKSTRPCIIEEASELVDAIDSENNTHMEEELGDLFFVVLFLCKLAEKEKRCDLAGVLKGVNEKLIRRHPHVFGEIKVDSVDGVVKQWDEIKKQEKGNAHRKSALDSIPKGLPALARAQKVHKKLHAAKYPDIVVEEISEPFHDEHTLGQLLFNIVAEAQEKGLDAEHALRKVLVEKETGFRAFEKGC